MPDLTPEDTTAILAAVAALCSLVTLACLWLVRRLVRSAATTFKFKVPPEVVTQLETFARMGASLIEERMRKFALGLVTTAPKTSQEKLDAAVEQARSLAPDGLATFTDEQVAMAVEAQLPSIRPVVEAAQPIVPGSKSIAPPRMSTAPGAPAIIPATPRIPSELAPTTFLDLDPDETTSQTPKAKRGE